MSKVNEAGAYRNCHYREPDKNQNEMLKSCHVLLLEDEDG